MTGGERKKVKVSMDCNHVEQMDDNEAEVLTAFEVDQAYLNFREATGADPLTRS